MRKTGVYYLNNSGSRWFVIDKDGMLEQITLKTVSGKDVTRRVLFYEMFGNFVSACISYKGKRIQVFADTILQD